MEKGTVKWFDAKKGYGFITYANGDIWFHYTVVIGEPLKAAETVSFDIEQNRKGPRAINIKRA